MPQLSIVVPIYKVEKYISKCIDSVLSQTFADFELILINDGSPDNCPKICDEYAKRDDRIRVIHKENGGQGSARNIGIDIAKGKYIGFVDSDDFIHPQYYEILMKLMNDKDVDIVCCHYQFIQPNETCDFETLDYSTILEQAKLIKTTEFMGNYNEHFRAVSWISPCTKLYKKEMFNHVRYPETVIDEDSYILHHVIGNSKRMLRIENKLYYYVWSQGSTSRSSFSPKRFHKNGANIDRVEFFKKTGIKQQEDYFKREYLLNVLKMYYLVRNEYPELMKEYKPYIKEYRDKLYKYLHNNDYVCNMEKVIYTIFYIFPPLAEKLYNKYLL